MNAVNLMPAGRRRGRARVSLSPAFLGLVAALVVVLLATGIAVSLHDKVSSRRAEVTRLNAATARWSAAAATYVRSVEALSVRAKSVQNVRALIADRYDWAVLLGQLAGRMPGDAALDTLNAAAPTGTGASSTGIALTGCAASQDDVAQTMVALRRITGISQVTLTTSGKTANVSTSTCKLPVKFQITLYFGQAAAANAGASSPSVTGTEAADTGAAQ